MNTIYFPARVCFIAAIIAGLLCGGCKKNRKEEARPEETGVENKGTRAELSADSMFLYAKEVYLWNESLPAYEVFNPRNYVSSDEEAGLTKELFDITRYATYSVTGKPYEYSEDYPDEPKYSYIFNTANANPVAYAVPAKSSVDLEGNGYDFGFQVDLFSMGQGVYNVRVEAVFNGSPAAAAGLKRGDVLTVVNGRQVTTNYTQATVDFLNAALFDAASIQLEVYRASDNKTFNASLNRSSYRSNPVYCDSVYTEGTKKIGYLAYARFSDITNSQASLDQAFSSFAAEGVTDLIVDLRYNGGGYVNTAEYLANLIAPSGVSGSVMYKEYFNAKMQSNSATILKNQPLPDDNGNLQYSNGKLVTYADVDYSVAKNMHYFSKKGPLNNVQKVVFIVTGSTASASELVINSLKPKQNIEVKIVGEKTYGKPVGFFPVRIDKYDVYYSMFESKNSEDQGGYYDGMSPDFTASDGSQYDFGDLRDPSTAGAFNYLVNGSFTAKTAKTSSVSSVKSVQSQKIESFKPAREEFKGMIENRFKMK